jgi:hypothetical protein
MKKPSLLCLDPSKTCTGYVIYDLETEKIVTYGTFKIEAKDEHKRKTDQYADETQVYADFFLNLFMDYGFDLIVTEYPHGSQSAKASWALSMVNATILTFSHLILSTPAITYLESDAKRSYFDKNSVSKDEVRQAMAKEFPTYEPALYHGKVVKYKDEAVSDALLILNTHLKNL